MADRSSENGAEQAIERLHAAMNVLVSTGKADDLMALLSRSDDVTAFLGWGGYEKGPEEVQQRWAWAAEQFKGGGPVTYETVSLVVTADLAYTTEIEHIRTRLDGTNEPTEWRNRVTHIFRREAGEWKLIHRHGQRLEERFKPSTRLK